MKKVLLVDDEALLIELIQFELERNHYEVKFAGGGHEGLKIFESEHFDIVVTDVRMPEGDGIELMKSAKKMRPNVPVILVTGFSDYSKQELLELGASAVFYKPIAFSDIVDKVTELTSRTM
jgi:CheY-like chemotaxis protein